MSRQDFRHRFNFSIMARLYFSLLSCFGLLLLLLASSVTEERSSSLSTPLSTTTKSAATGSGSPASLSSFRSSSFFLWCLVRGRFPTEEARFQSISASLPSDSLLDSLVVLGFHFCLLLFIGVLMLTDAVVPTFSNSFCRNVFSSKLTRFGCWLARLNLTSFS